MNRRSDNEPHVCKEVKEVYDAMRLRTDKNRITAAFAAVENSLAQSENVKKCHERYLCMLSELLRFNSWRGRRKKSIKYMGS